jgi:hypothetical protein
MELSYDGEVSSNKQLVANMFANLFTMQINTLQDFHRLQSDFDNFIEWS